MRDKEKDEIYFTDRFYKDSQNLKKLLEDYHNDIEIGEHPEEFDIRSYKYDIFIYAFYKFYSVHNLIEKGYWICQNVFLLQKLKRNISNSQEKDYIRL